MYPLLPRSYAHFVTIAKEIGLLENDMLELKDMLNEWKTAPSLMGSGVGSGGVTNEMFGGFTLGGEAEGTNNACKQAITLIKSRKVGI